MRANSDRINTFSFLANRDLKRELGRFDAMILYQEVMMREYYVYQKKSSLSEDSFAKQCAISHNIPLSHIPFQKVMSHYHQSFLIYPLACFELFLEGFIKEVRCLIPNQNNYKLDDRSGESKLERIIAALADNRIRIEIPPLYLNVYTYYRLSRNQLVHNLDDTKTGKKIEDHYKLIDVPAFLELIPMWPNALSRINHYELDDLVAFSALVIRIADYMTQSLFSFINWSKIDTEKDNGWVIQVKQIKKKPDRIKTLKGYVKSRYGVLLDNQQAKDFLNGKGL